MNEINKYWNLQPSQYFNYNAGIYHNGNKAYLIDPGMAINEIISIRDHLSASGLECEGIIITHHHWDHLMGIKGLNVSNVIAHEKFPEELQNHLESNRKSVWKWASEANVHGVEIPDASFVTKPVLDGFTQTVGNAHLMFIHTPGHTADHISVYDPQSETLWAGDILSDLEIPYIRGSIIAFIDTLEKVAGMQISAIIPGHGFPTRNNQEARSRILEDLAYLHELAERVQKCNDAGSTMSETIKSCQGIPIRFSNDNLQAHQWNVESVFKEFGGNCMEGNTGWEKELDGL
jgi:glyoxylase-like metal-dependent hydrolase (beta-lactamase superfamily II)